MKLFSIEGAPRGARRGAIGRIIDRCRPFLSALHGAMDAGKVAFIIEDERRAPVSMGFTSPEQAIDMLLSRTQENGLRRRAFAVIAAGAIARVAPSSAPPARPRVPCVVVTPTLAALHAISFA